MTDPKSDPKLLIKRLKKSGMTETEISEALRLQGIVVSQPTINRIASGAHKKTSFDIGMGLVRLCEKVSQQRL